MIVAAPRRPSRPARTGSARLARRGVQSAPQTFDGAVRSQLEELQRARIVNATFDVAAERGAANMSVAHIVERAGVSRRTFYEIFTDREDCLLAAFNEALSRARECVLPAYESGKTWRGQVRAGLVALLSFFDEQPLMAGLLVVESLAGGQATQQARAEIVIALTGVVEQGRAESKAPETIPPLTGEGIVGGVLAVLHSRLAANSKEPLVRLTNSLMSMIVLPYLGAAAARRELDRPTPTSPAVQQAELPSRDPFKDAGMRLTYRTVRVLTAIADHPGASNRLIAATSEISDQGQSSKLLSRLERVGMISNTGLAPAKGAPNSWTLTTRGAQVVETIRAHTEGRPESNER